MKILPVIFGFAPALVVIVNHFIEKIADKTPHHYECDKPTNRIVHSSPSLSIIIISHFFKNVKLKVVPRTPNAKSFDKENGYARRGNPERTFFILSIIYHNIRQMSIGRIRL